MCETTSKTPWASGFLKLLGNACQRDRFFVHDQLRFEFDAAGGFRHLERAVAKRVAAFQGFGPAFELHLDGGGEHGPLGDNLGFPVVARSDGWQGEAGKDMVAPVCL